MKTVREDRDRPGEITQRDLRDRNDEVQDENAAEDADDVGVPIAQKT
jgi:hypothetical protein